MIKVRHLNKSFNNQNVLTNISVEFENIKIYDKESCSACQSTLMLFLRRFKDDMRPYVLHDGKFHIAIGKGVDDAMEGTLFVGNCTRFLIFFLFVSFC